MSARTSMVICLCIVTPIAAWFWRARSSALPARAAAPAITKQPVVFENRTFDPASPPSDMPPLANGEEAECESNFQFSANVAGQARKADATHALVAITGISVNLQLKVTIWTPLDVTAHVVEHEQGHRQISEHYYQTADEVARQIAAKYMNDKVEVTGVDLAAETNKLFQHVADEITQECNRQLDPEPAQLLYDGITDHGRNEVVVSDAVASAIKNVVSSPRQAAGN